jgi:HAD superfamily hydrolase (TIGR01549 family)
MYLQALTLDLDDTLWPALPTLRRAETALRDWLLQQAPATAASHDAAAMRALREAVLRDRPDWSHDLGALRLECIRRALQAGGDDPARAAEGFEVFLAERQRVDLFDDVLPALERLAARWPIVALSNGNADVHRVPGLGQWFHAAVSAQQFGVGKPAPAAFAEACRQAGALPAHTLHIGDDAALDVDGALDAGLQAAWVCRPELTGAGSAVPRGQPQHVVANLAQLADRLRA